MNKHDVVVIGGSLAGAACVRELERQGIDAIALERGRFPRSKVCGGFLSPGAVEGVARLGLLNRVMEAGAVEVKSARVRVRGIVVEIPIARPALGISRNTLDEIFAQGTRVYQGCNVREVQSGIGGFTVEGIQCSVVIDASGKLGRFTKRRNVDEFGVQYLEPFARGAVLEFSFFDDSYGGTVSVEDGRSNSCFLVKKSGLARYLDHPGCLVTGPLAYDKLPSQFIAIGDAAGMIDPFCGEGMHHAIDSGIIAARVVASGIRRRASYGEMKWQYELESDRRWTLKRAMGAGMRWLWQRPSLFSRAMRLKPEWIVNRFWL